MTARYWIVPRMWAGQTVAILASGPSMSQAVADGVRHLPRIAINNTWQLARDADIVYAADRRWWLAHPDAHVGPGLRVSIEPTRGTLPDLPFPALVLRNSGAEGFDRDPGCLRTLGNSGGQAIQIAVHAGAARILLFGFDMHGGHWHGPHARPCGNPSQSFLARCTRAIAHMAQHLPAGVEVINCTPGSALRCFPFLRDDLEAAA
jgi:hypothetical protein